MIVAILSPVDARLRFMSGMTTGGRWVPMVRPPSFPMAVRGFMNTSYPVRSGTDCSYGFSPAAMRRAMVVTLASSIACPCSTRCSPARTAAPKPDAALAFRR